MKIAADIRPQGADLDCNSNSILSNLMPAFFPATEPTPRTPAPLTNPTPQIVNSSDVMLPARGIVSCG